tara:strand:+ start:126 stop:1151 length:1026 start_codon:yes stop_codon:yes gene_type:complete
MIRQYLQNGIATFNSVQIYNYQDSKREAIRVGDKLIGLELGKSAAKVKPPEEFEYHIDSHTAGEFYLWYSKPLINYYHLVLDGLGCLWHFLDLRKRNPDITLLLNCTPKPGYNSYPPFVSEMLDLFDVKWEYTNPSTIYETVHFGDTLNQDERGKRTQPHPNQWELIDNMVKRSLVETDVPEYEKIYLSRRAHANPLADRKAVIGEDNTVKRGLTNEDEVVEILTELGYTEVFGENYTLAEKIALFSKMKKYISTAGAGVTNMLWVRDHDVRVGGIHTPGFPFPSNVHNRHICAHKPYCKATIDLYKGKVLFHDPEAGAKNYNNPWYINNLDAFKSWALSI